MSHSNLLYNHLDLSLKILQEIIAKDLCIMKVHPSPTTCEIILGAKTHPEKNFLYPPTSIPGVGVGALTDYEHNRIYLSKTPQRLASISLYCHEFGHLADANLDHLDQILPTFSEIAAQTIDFTAEEAQALKDSVRQGSSIDMKIIRSVSEKILKILLKDHFHTIDYELAFASPAEIFDKTKAISPFLKTQKIPSTDGSHREVLVSSVYDKRFKRVEVLGIYFELAAVQILENSFLAKGWLSGEITLEGFLSGNAAYARAKKLTLELMKRNLVPKNSGVLKRSKGNN